MSMENSNEIDWTAPCRRLLLSTITKVLDDESGLRVRKRTPDFRELELDSRISVMETGEQMHLVKIDDDFRSRRGVFPDQE